MVHHGTGTAAMIQILQINNHVTSTILHMNSDDIASADRQPTTELALKAMKSHGKRNDTAMGWWDNMVEA